MAAADKERTPEHLKESEAIPELCNEAGKSRNIHFVKISVPNRVDRRTTDSEWEVSWFWAGSGYNIILRHWIDNRGHRAEFYMSYGFSRTLEGRAQFIQKAADKIDKLLCQ
jgi:hypothetical protein